VSSEQAHTRLTVEERLTRGLLARKNVPRSIHGRWKPEADRPDSLALLRAQAETRVPELVPIRYERMRVSPFAFYRGAALIMAADLAATPRTGMTVQLCGDAHLGNFGVFGTPERRMLFDINDFDETLPGPWEWDLKRLSASLEVAGRDLGFAAADRRSVVLAGAREYRRRMRQAARMGSLQVWYERLEARRLLRFVRYEIRQGRALRSDLRAARRRIEEAGQRDSVRVVTKRVRGVGDEIKIVAEPPLIVPLEDLVAEGTEWEAADQLIEDLLVSYRQTLGHHGHAIEEYRYVHAARKVVGVGSVGTRCYILLLMGRDEKDPLVLQVKEAQESVLERFAVKSQYSNHGERVVSGQRLMQAASDPFLGWQRIRGLDGQTRDYYVRQFHDWKGGANLEDLSVTGAILYARLCAATLARAHARWGDRIAIASYLGGSDAFDEAIADFSAAYADQNERDYVVFKAALESAQMAAEPLRASLH
jgi:uncharacterized protein (DUF2252 family)